MSLWQMTERKFHGDPYPWRDTTYRNEAGREVRVGIPPLIRDGGGLAGYDEKAEASMLLHMTAGGETP